MAGGRRKRAVLSPAGEPGIHQLRVAPQEVFWAQATTLHSAGPVAFEEHVRGICKSSDQLRTAGRGQVYGEGVLAPSEAVCGVNFGLMRATDLDNVGTEVGEDHRGEGAGAERAHVDDAHAGQRAGLRCDVLPAGHLYLLSERCGVLARCRRQNRLPLLSGLSFADRRACAARRRETGRRAAPALASVIIASTTAERSMAG
jgi:hypothetical protein